MKTHRFIWFSLVEIETPDQTTREYLFIELFKIILKYIELIDFICIYNCYENGHWVIPIKVFSP